MNQIQWTKPVCQLDADNLYIGQTDADLDIYTRDGSYIIPGGCIDTEPPEIPENHAARWNGEGWDVIEDHRGKIAYRKDTGEAVVVAAVGALSDDLTLTPRPSETHEWDGGRWVENAVKKAAAERGRLKEAKAAKLAEINRAAQDFVNAAAELDKVPGFEVATWPLQAEEARAWAAGKAADTPLLAQIAAARGLDLDKLRAAALRKAQAYTALTAGIAGQRQALADKLDKAKTPEEADAVAVSYTLPG